MDMPFSIGVSHKFKARGSIVTGITEHKKSRRCN